jgi:hypothetical protein
MLRGPCYAQSSGVNIAYQVLGEGPRDLVFVPGWVSKHGVIWLKLWALSRSEFGHSMGPLGFSLNELTKLQLFSHP